MASDEKLADSTPVLAEVTLPPVEYSPETEAFIDTLVYSFPPSACCK